MDFDLVRVVVDPKLVMVSQLVLYRILVVRMLGLVVVVVVSIVATPFVGFHT